MFANNTVETANGTGDEIVLTGSVTFTNEAGLPESTIPFSASFSDGDLVDYYIVDANNNQVGGKGVFNSLANSITRNDSFQFNATTTTVNNAPISNMTLAPGVKTIRCSPIASFIEYSDKNIRIERITQSDYEQLTEIDPFTLYMF